MIENAHIYVKDLSYDYGSNGPKIMFPDFRLRKREALLILGPSGSGKSTLLNCLAGLLQATTGSIQIDGQNLSDMVSNQRQKFVKKNIGIVFQRPFFIDSLSVRENLSYTYHFRSLAVDEERIRSLLAMVSLSSQSEKSISSLSEGQKQRVSLIRAVLHRPTLVLADEPTSALDDESAYAVISTLKQQAKSGHSNIVVVSHDHRLMDHFDQKIYLKKI